jgi:two-component system sensor kinase FixL
MTLPYGEVDRGIEQALDAVRGFFDCDRCGLLSLPEGAERAFITHASYAENIPHVPGDSDRIPLFPWAHRELLQGNVINFARLSDLPAEAEEDRQSWASLGVCSSLEIPLHVVACFRYVIVVQCLRAERVWPDECILRLRLLGEVFANALQRERDQEKLRESEARLRLATDAAGVGLWSMQVGSERVWVSDQLRELFRFAADEAITLETFLLRIHPGDREDVGEAVREASARGTQFDVEYRIQLPGDETRWIAALGQVRHGLQGEPEHLFGCSMDITQRRRTEQALIESEAHYRTLFEAVPQGIVLIGADGHIRTANLSQARLYGYESPQQLEGLHALLLVAGKDRERVAKHMSDLPESGESHDLTYTAARRDGTEFLAEATSVTLHGVQGEEGGYLCFTRDITERKRSESERLQLRVELAHMSRVMTMGELATSLAHEINQPLGAILNNASAATLMLPQIESSVGEIEEILTDIVQDAKRAGDVIRKIRGIVKKGDAYFEPLQLNALIEDAVALFYNTISMNKVSLQMELAPSLPEIRADRVRLQQVMVNLLTNAMDAMRTTSSNVLTVCSRLDAPDRIIVSVTDSGTGLAHETIDRVFDPFFTTKKNGLGMGLRICQSIVEEHGGRIWAEDNPGAGATFSFSLTNGGVEGNG